MPSVTVPTVEDVAAQLQADPADTRLVGAYLAAVETQDQVCTTDPYTAALAEALHRRVAFVWSSKAHTLGVLDTEFGTQYMPRYHPDWDLLEGPHRKVWVA